MNKTHNTHENTWIIQNRNSKCNNMVSENNREADIPSILIPSLKYHIISTLSSTSAACFAKYFHIFTLEVDISAYI